MIRRALTWDERLLVAEWYLDRCGVREIDERDFDTETRNRVIVHLLALGMSREDVAASFGLTTAGVSRIINKLRRKHGVATEKSATKSGCRNSGCQVAHEPQRQ